MRFEQDEVTLLGGVRHGRTLGSPVAIEIGNTEWVRSRQVARGDVAGARRHRAARSPSPGPGHADLAGMQKYGFTDARDVLERASARETAARVAAGAVAKAAAARLGVEILSHVVQMGAARPRPGRGPRPADLDRGRRVAGALLRRRRRGGDDRRDRGGGQGRRLARRRRRGARLRRAGRPRQPRALGPQARRPAGPGADEHPGGEGRRDRRRLRGGRPAGVATPTTRSSGTPSDRRLPPRVDPRRRHRGRHLAPASCSWRGRP